MFDHGIRWSGLIVKLCGCDVQALQMNSRWMRQLMVLSVLAEGADRSIQQFGQRRRWWKSRAGRPDKEGEGDHRGASRLLGLGQSTSALYESVSRLRRPPPGRTLPRTSSSMWLTSGIGMPATSCARRRSRIQASRGIRDRIRWRLGCPRVEHSTLKSISSSQIVPTEQARSMKSSAPTW